MIDGEVANTSRIIDALPGVNIDFRYSTDRKIYETFLNNENVEEAIRNVEISKYVSPISQISEVRKKMVELQREIGVFKGIVMDGRDIGTVVFPDADIKIFMTASPEIRARRRFNELKAKGVEVDYKDILDNINYRDSSDSGRVISPLKKADDAIELDNSNMTPEEQMAWFKIILKKLRDED